MWGFDVIQRDGVGGGEDVTAVTRFLLHGITYNVPHTAVSLAGSRNNSACPGTEKCGGDDVGGWLGGGADTEEVSFYRCVTKELATRKGQDISWLAGGIRGDVCAAGFNLLMRKIYPSCLRWGEFRDARGVA